MDYERIQVTCYSGYKVNKYPKAFTDQGHRCEIQKILDRWYEGDTDPARPAVRYFKVKTTEGRSFRVMHQAFLKRGHWPGRYWLFQSHRQR